MRPSNKYNVIGLMSGTSLDGLDIAYCVFELKKKKWSFSLIACETIKYPAMWSEKLSKAHLLAGFDLQMLDNEFGLFIGSNCNRFIKKNRIKGVDFIASHGHTIFHQPGIKLTFQLGNGTAIHSETKIPVINDFRSLDVLLGGQGAPLVPIGDQLLFGEYDICLNLGGIANLSMMRGSKRIAFDICYVNMGLNHLANMMGKTFDKNGVEASKGKVSKTMLAKLTNAYMRFRDKRPSLGREGFEKYFQPILENENVSLQDKLYTFCESISVEISSETADKKKLTMLATGGGALNKFLLARLQNTLQGKVDIVVPEKKIIEYKDSLNYQQH